MSNYPSREAVLSNILRNLNRHETPGRYIAVQRLHDFLYRLSDAQYESYLERLRSFDPDRIDPKVRKAIVDDMAKHDEMGVIRAMAESVFDSPDLLRYAKAILTETMG